MREGLHKIICSEDTIVAVSTPPGRSGIGVVRLSGEKAVAITERFLRSSSALSPGRFSVGRWVDDCGNIVDQVVVTFFKSPHSYTGEDVVEVSAHGNPVVLGRILAMAKDSGARLAGPGEFTLRAVANGKMDLIQAEAVQSFVEAQTEYQARVAMRQISGALSNRLRPAKERLLDLIARIEAGIDFAEDDIDVLPAQTVAAQIAEILEELRALQNTFGYGRILIGGLRLAIVGKPNVGKSSLFNRLVSAERAIVTEVPGTTRDVLTETVNVDGIPLRFADTAGVRNTEDRVEALGVSRTFETISESDLALVVLDGSQPIDNNDHYVIERSKGVRHMIVINKSDLPQAIMLGSNGVCNTIAVSAKTGAGLEDLKIRIRRLLHAHSGDLADDLVLTSDRQAETLTRAIEAITKASGAVLAGTPHEMVLLDLYAGLSALNELTGEVVSEDILDRIFSTFCIGK
jgi:tRNA modification GTPase